ncbi:hypothetical protein JOB18_006314 [Solea senegalensis]|uniref:Uncharacterized protein n=1 Tax=Solea senegalensis TaxID=28829 RepID=A0AAV6SP95_SOLSE|nr:hypothetical protein JOB18_006314 [Solea senegalensis]
MRIKLRVSGLTILATTVLVRLQAWRPAPGLSEGNGDAMWLKIGQQLPLHCGRTGDARSIWGFELNMLNLN